jgi:NAD(P)-dependent dehydrogenase (short-subunit alcohol dehydrogenase family)
MPGALVTGAGRGIGLEIARRLAARGFEVAVADVDEGNASAAAGELGGGAWSVPLDVTDADAVEDAAAKVVERSGSLEVWVNNAGILHTGFSYEQPVEQHRRMLEVNAMGTINGTLAAIGRMREQGRGHVINVISLAGLVTAPGIVGYSASKHAAMAFSIGTLADLKRAGIKDIHISTVCPDGVWTPMVDVNDPEDALSFSGVMFMPQQIAERVEGLLDRPEPVLAIPRWRGRFARFIANHPRLAVGLTPLVMRDALRRQRSFKKKVEAGRWPPPEYR